MRNHDYSTSFPAVREFIYQNSQKMRSPNRKRNRITWILAVLLPLLIFFSCQRETYIEPQGATLSFIANDSVQSSLDFVLQKHADKKWRSVLRSHAGTMHGIVSAPNESYDKLKVFAEELKTITGVTELYLSATTTTVEESRLSRLSYKIFNCHVDATVASNEQLRTEIETKLKETGLHNLKVQLVNENGRRQVKFEPTGKNHDFAIELTLRDGSNITAIAEKW
jgi:hypothetical protein